MYLSKIATLGLIVLILENILTLGAVTRVPLSEWSLLAIGVQSAIIMLVLKVASHWYLDELKEEEEKAKANKNPKDSK